MQNLLSYFDFYIENVVTKGTIFVSMLLFMDSLSLLYVLCYMFLYFFYFDALCIKEEQKKEAGFIQQRKRRALNDLFKTLQAVFTCHEYFLL